ncbi:MAG TPA: PQQ-binding-like beta-propeller repeat protein [Blastocatellia bacterium]|nr:PQQ-binding-like beta-propeller repeat protein [Blastocatellia bacterium]
MRKSSSRYFVKAFLLALVFLLLPPTAMSDPQARVQSKKERQAEPRQGRGGAHAQETVEAAATSTSHLALPFKRAWQYLTDSASMQSPSLDGARIYLPLEGGRVICLDRETGTLLWTSEPGGIITSPVTVGDNSVYIATRKTADDGSEVGGSLRAVDKATGLTVWVKDYSRPFVAPLELAANRIYGGSADGSFYALASENGEVIWKVETQDVVHGRTLVASHAVYFGSDDGALRAVDAERGQIIWKYQTGGKIIGRPAADERALYFGSGDGYVHSVDILTGKLRWKSRTGAAIEASPVLVGDRLLVASFDNFVYALSPANGNRIWKRRLENRLASSPVVQGDASLVAPLRGDYVAVFLNSDGRRVNLYQLDKDFEIVADPIFVRDTLVLATNKGLVVATATKSSDNQTRAVKK